MTAKTYAEPSLAVLGLNLVTVAHPVAVPLPESRRVVNTNGIDILDLKASTLQLVNDKAERSRSIGTGENVLVHEQTPDQILVLPSLSETSNLQEEDTIVIKHVVDLGKEASKVTDTDVLGHLKTGDLVVAALGNRNVAVVHAENLALLLGDANLAHGAVAPGGLVATKSNTGDLGAIVFAGKSGEGAPAAANIQHSLVLLELNLLADNSQLVVLELLKALLRVDVRDDTRGVDHAGTEEPAVKVITAVIVVSDLLLICVVEKKHVSTCITLLFVLSIGVGEAYPENECA